MKPITTLTSIKTTQKREKEKVAVRRSKMRQCTSELDRTAQLSRLTQRQVRQVERVSRKKAREDIQEVSMSDFFIYPSSEVRRTVYREWHKETMKRFEWMEAELQHPSAEFVAMEKGPFGEGAERMAYRFYEVGSDMKTIVGRPRVRVAKESRLVLDEDVNGAGDEHARKTFVRVFCRAQQLARRLADELAWHKKQKSD
jgi:hypothetical protein